MASKNCNPRPHGIKGGNYCDTPRDMYSVEWWAMSRAMAAESRWGHLVGQTLANASKIAATQGFTVRETTIDGRSLIVTQDLRDNRINVATVTRPSGSKVIVQVLSIG